MEFLNLFTKFFSKILELVGSVATIETCVWFFDEPDVPKELTDLHNK